MKKAILISILLVILVAAGAGWWFMAHRFDAMVESEIEQAASEFLGTNVRFKDASLSVLDGKMRIDELEIGNPPGFQSENAMVFGAIDVELDIRSQSVSLVSLEGSHFSIEERGGETNLDVLRQALDARISSEARSAFGDSGEMLVIEKFRMTNTSASFQSETLQKSSEATIAEFELSDLRGEPEALVEQISSQVIDTVMEAASRAMLEAEPQ